MNPDLVTKICVVVILIVCLMIILMRYKEDIHGNFIAAHYHNVFDDLLFKIQTSESIEELEYFERESVHFIDNFFQYENKEVKILYEVLEKSINERRAKLHECVCEDVGEKILVN